jgi:hypothetical protein
MCPREERQRVWKGEGLKVGPVSPAQHPVICAGAPPHLHEDLVLDIMPWLRSPQRPSLSLGEVGYTEDIPIFETLVINQWL